MLEIESKFSVPDSDTFARLLGLTALGDYSLKEPATVTLTDHYLDTVDGSILRGGFACRVRHDHSQNTWTGTIKGLGGADGVVHRREEYEAAITPHALPDQWPTGPARDLALQLSAGQPLVELFAIHQQRHARLVIHTARGVTVAELSLDRVEFSVGPRRSQTFELEIELMEGGALEDLRALGAALADTDLRPESKSKFERGLALLSLPSST